MTVELQPDSVGAVDGGSGLLTTGLAQVTNPASSGAAAPQHLVLSASAAAARLLGTSQAALLGADLRQVLCDKRDRRSLDGWKSLERQLEVQQEGCVQLPVPAAPAAGEGSGSDVSSAACWLDVSVTALPGGKYAWSCDAVLGAAADRQQHVQVGQQVHAPLQHWRRLSSVETAALRALAHPVWVCDARGRVLFANPAFCRVAGCGEDDAAGRPWTQLLPRPRHPADAAAVQQVEAAITLGQPVQAEVQCRGCAAAAASSASLSASASGSSDDGDSSAVACAADTISSDDTCRSDGGDVSPSRSRWWGVVSVSPMEEASEEASSGAPLMVCTLLGGPAEPAGHSADSATVQHMAASGACGASAAAAAPALHAVPPALAQLCNQALASTSEGVVLTDPTQPGNPIVWANAAFERMTGYSQASVLGRGHSFLQGPDSDPVVIADIAAAMEEGRPVVAEILVYRRDGTPFWCQVSITPIRDATTGQVANFVAVQRDISQRKAVEAASQIREQALSNLNEGICICDASLKDCPVVYCNNAFLRITGYSRKEVIGRNCRFLQGPRTDPATVQRLATALHEGREITVELLNYRKNGEEFYNMLSITPVRDASGRLLSFIGVQSDITELALRREAEKELQEAKVAAETAVEAKSMFLANMSHEIRTPLNGMIAVAQLLLSSGLTPEQRELTDTILESGNTLLTILGDILDFSKIDHNSMVLESAPLALRDTVEASIEMVAADAGRKGLDVAYCLAPPLVARRLMGDSIRIRQILSNLLSNAVKFTSSGEVVVDAWVDAEPAGREGPQELLTGAATSTVAAAAPAAGGAPAPAGCPRLHITVRDTGIGISEVSMARLFQQFRQGHESMSRKYGGTGLGLAISRRLAELMGGNVWAESVEGEGSTFHFTMKLHWEGEAPPPGSNCASGAAAVPAPDPAASAGPAATPGRGTSTSFESSLGVGDSPSASRRASESANEPPHRRPSSSSADSVVPAASLEAAAAASGADSGESCSSGHGAEEQRLLLQQHHEALLQRLAQRSMLREGATSAAAAAAGGATGPEAPATLRLSGLSCLTDAPDTPCVHQPGALPFSGVSAASSSSMLNSLAGSCRSLAALALGTAALSTQPRPGFQRGSSASRASAETMPAAAPLPPAVALAGAAGQQRGSGDSVRSCPERMSMEQGPPQPAPPPVNYRMSSFYAPSQPIQPINPPPKPLRARSRDSSPPAAVDAPLATAVAAPDAPLRPASPPLTAPPAEGCREVPAAGENPMRRRSADCGASSLSAPPAPSSAARPAADAARTTEGGLGGAWGAFSTGGEAATVLRGRSVCIDIAHSATAVQIAQSCRLLGMEVALEPSQQAPPDSSGGGCEFCITTADKALAAVRAGWRGRPLVVLGRREDLPSNLQPLATTVSKPVKHTRLVGALLKANAFSRSKQQAPLHLDPHMLSLLPERSLLNNLAANRRISLDNSALDRRRWELAAAAAAAAAADADSTLAPVRLSAPVERAGISAATEPAPAAPVSAAAPELASAGDARDYVPVVRDLPAFQSMQQLDAPGRRSMDGSAGSGGAANWQPELAVIHSDGSREGSQRSSLDMTGGAGVCAPAMWPPHSHHHHPLQTVHEELASGGEREAPGGRGLPASAPSTLAAAAAAAAAAIAAAAARVTGAAAPAASSRAPASAPGAGRPPRILVAEDNLINQRVIRKVLQRVVPAASVEIVGNGLEALAAVHRGSFDLVLMDIHMPEMDGLEASQRLRAELPPERRPVVVALSADTLQELHQQCREAGIHEFICKPFRVEDVERVLELVQPRLRCSAQS